MSVEADFPIPIVYEQLTDGLYSLEEHTPKSQASMVVVVFHSFPTEGQRYRLKVDRAEETKSRAWRNAGEFKRWLSLLAFDFPDARILTVSYPYAFKNLQSTSHRMDLQLPYERLLKVTVCALRIHNECPVFLVGENLGCFVVQELCLTAQRVSSLGWSSDNDEAERLLFLVSGIVFIWPPRSAATKFEWHNNPIMASGMYLERSWAEFRMLRETRNWSICELLDKDEDISKSQVIVPRSFISSEDCRHEVHEVVYRICERDDVLSVYKHFREFLRIMLDEWRRVVDKLLQEQNIAVGLETVMQELIMTAQIQDRSRNVQEENVHYLGLTGVGGVGKTTLATTLFNFLKRDSHLGYTCFVKLGECAKDVKQITVHELILKHMRRWGGAVHTTDWNILQGKRVLLVLDDIDSEILEQVLRISGTFARGSWVIGTSRIHSSFDCSEFRVYEVQPLKEQDARNLFRSFAFPGNEVAVELQPTFEQVVRYCGGLPLTLEVLGKHLQGKSEHVWVAVLKALQGAELPPEDNIIEEVLSKQKTCFDSLADLEKNIFLDVATCFHGEILEETLAAWRGMYPGIADSGWANLLNMSLANIVYSGPTQTPSTRLHRGLPASSKLGVYKVISLHKSLRLLGRRLSSQAPYMHQRLSDVESACKLLEDRNPKVLKKVKILKLDTWLGESSFDMGRISMMPRLKILWLKDVPLSGFESNLTCQLSSIRIRLSGRSISDAYEFRLEKEIVSSPHSRFLGLFAASENLRHLSFISRPGIPEFPMRPPNTMPVPDLQNLLQLGHLVLDTILVESLPESFGQLKNLRFLQMSNCSSLQSLPSSFGELSAIEVLKLEDLGGLKALPDTLGNLKRLKRFEIQSCHSLLFLPDSVGGLTRLDSLMLRDLNSLEVLPVSVGELRNLTHMELSSCKVMKHLPKSIGSLHALEYLELSYLMVVELPAEIGNLSQLEGLFVRDFEELEKLPETIGNLRNLQYLELHNLNKVSRLPSSLGELQGLASMNISGCKQLRSLTRAFDSLTGLRALHLRDLPLLRTPPSSLTSLRNLRELRIERVPKFMTLLPKIDTLRYLNLFCVELGEEEEDFKLSCQSPNEPLYTLMTRRCLSAAPKWPMIKESSSSS